MSVYLGIDVGTGSARAGFFDENGVLLATASKPITRFQPKQDFSQQSSAEIWEAICYSVKTSMSEAGIAAADVQGIGFDATCSLVVQDADGNPVSVSPDGAPEQDIVMWLDHRAVGDANEINETGAKQLNYVGGVISPEMQMPKLRWLKREMPDAWAKAASFWDLPDWLAHRASGTDTRSLCSTVCKWAYLGQEGQNGEGWDREFLATIGLEDLADGAFAKIGTQLASAGDPVGTLSDLAAQELGLAAGIPVSAGLIDAYAGALSTLGAMPDLAPIDTRMAVIAGTSTCHIAVSDDAVFVPGVWGPYRSVLLPEMWALEGGQSAAGALIDAVIDRHSASAGLRDRAAKEGRSIYELMGDLLDAQDGESAFLTANRHVQPDFHGNRAPLADPTRKGAISGLTLDVGELDLALDYLATVQALAYGTRHVLEEMRERGAAITTMVVSGGLAKNTLFLREMSDATGCTVIVPEQQEPVLLGAAMLGAVASGEFEGFPSAMAQMSGKADVVTARAETAPYHDKKYKVFRRMQDDFAAYAELMTSEEGSK